MKILLYVLLFLLIVIIILGLARTYKSQHSPNQKNFLAGKIPNPLPDGSYKGTVTGFHTTWQGKTFFSSKNSGINNFGDGQRYPFKTYTGSGYRDKGITTEKIDYQVAGNPWWAKPVLDEIVEVGPNQYLGKIHYRIIPGLPFTVGYFHLSAEK